MVIFRVTENINIKTTDGTLVKYSKLKSPSNLYNETIYIASSEEFTNLENVFSNVGNDFKARRMDTSKVRYLTQFPKELGLLNEEKVDLTSQLKGSLKEDISLVILGNPGSSISEMICASTALRILSEELKKKFKTVKIDLYLNASENKFYSRDKMILVNQSFINKVQPLSINVKEFCAYDYFIDLSLVNLSSYYKTLSKLDIWLYKFGIDSYLIPKSKKYNKINIDFYKPKEELENKILNLKKKKKILLFHPYSANITKSIPKEIATKLLEDLIFKMSDYTIISVLKIDNKFEDDNFHDLSNYSKNFLDLSYIVSNTSKVITVDTSVYHICDAFIIPTLVIFSEASLDKNSEIYPLAKAIYIKDKSKSLSKFIFPNEALLIDKYKGWLKLKSSKIIKLLESF